MRALFKASLFYLSLCLYKCLRLETVGGLLFASSQWSVLVFSLTSLLFIESVVPWMKTLSSHKKMKEKKRNEALRQRIGHKIKRFECSCCCCFPRNRQPSVKKGGARTSCLHGKQHQQQKNIIPLFLLRLLYFVKEKKNSLMSSREVSVSWSVNKPDTQYETKRRRKCVAYYCLRQITWTIFREWTSFALFPRTPSFFSSLKSEWIINVMAHRCWM